MFLCYTHNTLQVQHQWTFLLLQMGKNSKTQTICRIRDLETFSLQQHISFKYILPGLRKSWKIGDRKSEEPEEMEAPKKQDFLNKQMSAQVWTHRDWNVMLELVRSVPDGVLRLKGIPKGEKKWVSCAFPWTLFLLWFFLLSHYYVLMFCFIFI